MVRLLAHVFTQMPDSSWNGTEPKLDRFEAFPDVAASRALQRSSWLPEMPNPFDVCG